MGSVLYSANCARDSVCGGWRSFVLCAVLLPCGATAGETGRLYIFHDDPLPPLRNIVGTVDRCFEVSSFLQHLLTTAYSPLLTPSSVDSLTAANLMPLFIIMCELFNGILRPHAQMPALWKYTMYYLSPFTYWIGGVLSSVLEGVPVVCDAERGELSIFHAPEGRTCGEYAAEWIGAGTVGYLDNPAAIGECGYCEFGVGDDVSFSPFLSFFYNFIKKYGQS